MFNYPVTLTPDDGTILVTFADVPEAITFGADEQEALMQAVARLKVVCRFMSMHARACLYPARPKEAKKRSAPARLNAPSSAFTRP